MPLLIHPYHLGKKRGALLQLADAFADIAPLPGWSHETLDEAIEGLKRGTFFPSSAFALDSLLMQQIAPMKGGSVTLCALCSPNEIEERLRDGFSCLKLKISQLSLSDILAFVAQVDGRAEIRLDANRSLSFESALKLMHHLPKKGIAYIEEPVQTLGDLQRLAPIAPLPIALDESLRDQPLELLEALPNVVCWVLKPTLIGSLGRLTMLKRRAENRGILPLLSSSFESAIGIACIAHLALALKFPTKNLGLDTSSALEENFFTIPRSPILDLKRVSDQIFRATRGLSPGHCLRRADLHLC